MSQRNIGHALEIVHGWRPHDEWRIPSWTSNEFAELVANLGPDDKRAVARIPMCHACRQSSWGLWVRLVKANGVHEGQLRCIACGYKHRSIGAMKLPAPMSIPLWKDNRTDAPCARCTRSSDGVELHHWAPRHLFADADWWPTSNLCRWCHGVWHRAMTPTGKRITTFTPTHKPKTNYLGLLEFRDGLGPYDCGHCGEAANIWHQWAPSGVFWDAGFWPTHLLCHECHDEWTDTMTAAYGVLAA